MLPRNVAAQHPLRKDVPPRTYKTASKHTVVKDGEKELVCGFQSGHDMKTNWEVGDIHRPLSSASKMVKAGSCVCFDSEANGGSYIYNYETGQSMRIYEKDGIYVLPAWIKAHEQDTQGFQRHAKQ